MIRTQRPLWAKGILLEPQHLQAQDRFFEELISFQLSSMNAYPMGFSSLDLNLESVAAGTFEMRAAAGIFPDGSMFEFPSSDHPPPPRPFAELFDGDVEQIAVYLTLPEYRGAGKNVVDEMGSTSVRYSREVVRRRDENTGIGEKPIQIARKNLGIRFEGESLDGTTALQVALLVRGAEGQFRVAPTFVPPLTDIVASEHLMGIARSLVEILAAKSTGLGGLRRQRNRGLADFGVSDTGNFWLLYTINTHFPIIRHLFEVKRGQPVELYDALSSLAGALTTFSDSYEPADVPSYDHLDLGECFTELDRVIKELLETVVPTNHVSLPLQLSEPFIYATAIDQDRYLEGQAFLVVTAGGDQGELVRRVPQLAKVSSSDQVERLIRQALSGVRLHHVDDPPRDIPVKAGALYFRLEQSGPDWDAVRRARNLVVYAPSDIPDPELELVVHLPKDQSKR